MGVADGRVVQFEKVPELAQAEMSLYVLFLVYHTAAECFLVGLPLEDLLLYGSCL